MSSTATNNLPLLSESNLTPAQNSAIDFVYERDYSLLSVPMGFGKTVCTLTALNELLRDGVVHRVLVVAPLRVCDQVWATETDKWSHLHATVGVATGDEAQRVGVINSGVQIVAINFDNLPWLAKSGAIDAFDALVVDELTKLKNPGGAWLKAIRRYIPKFKLRVGLTGTFAEEGLDKLYAMALVVDGGKALGRNKQAFLDKYFIATDYNRYNWAAREGTSEAIAAKIAPFTYQHTEDDQNLPPLVEDFLYVDLPVDARDAYTEMAKECVINEGTEDEVVAVNMAVVTGKLQQIASGFAYAQSHTVPLHWEKESAVSDEIDPGEPTMIVYQFTHELDWLRKLYPEAMVLGDKCTKAQADEAVTAWNSGRLNQLIIHPKSAGHGMNLQYGGNRIVFVGPIWSKDQTAQVIARLHRRGSPFNGVRVTYVVARGTVEDEVMIPRVDMKGIRAARFERHLVRASGIEVAEE